jgi:hypothetical protein
LAAGARARGVRVGVTGGVDAAGGLGGDGGEELGARTIMPTWHSLAELKTVQSIVS